MEVFDAWGLSKLWKSVQVFHTSVQMFPHLVFKCAGIRSFALRNKNRGNGGVRISPHFSCLDQQDVGQGVGNGFGIPAAQKGRHLILEKIA
jgi:hypothetical protein